MGEYEDAICLAHTHANREQEAICSLRFQLANARRELVEANARITDFQVLRVANVLRCKSSYFELDNWNGAEWGCAIAGEVGELCNLMKKKRRGELVPTVAIAEEIADVVIYADLIAASLGLNLWDIVKDKFNKTSDKIGNTIKLGDAKEGR